VQTFTWLIAADMSWISEPLSLCIFVYAFTTFLDLLTLACHIIPSRLTYIPPWSDTLPTCGFFAHHTHGKWNIFCYLSPALL
jgi:hypothetical protein